MARFMTFPYCNILNTAHLRKTYYRDQRYTDNNVSEDRKPCAVPMGDIVEGKQLRHDGFLLDVAIG